MGSGISLGEDHVFEIIQRELTNEFYENSKSRLRYIDGIEVQYDFSEEVEWRTKLRNAYDVLLYIKNSNKNGTPTNYVREN